MPAKAPTVLMIMDGWGWREETAGNAVRLARTPNFDRLLASRPHAFLQTCGLAVGLPEGQMGNSEVGHLNIGAGRVVVQELPRIDRAIETGDLAARLADTHLPKQLTRAGVCHVLGLISPGGVHSHQRHAMALTRALGEEGVRCLVHAFTDGRDTPPDIAFDCLRDLEENLPATAEIATVSGRYYAMDRDNRWDRIALAYDALVHGRGVAANSARAAIEEAMARGHTDEFIPPAVVGDYTGMKDGDGLVCINFRPDRVREILTALLSPYFDEFDRGGEIAFSSAVGMVSYGAELEPYMRVLFEPKKLDHGLSETVSRAGLRQIHLAETEKYPHVTYFLNGGREKPFEGEEWVVVPSPKVATYDLKPEMSAPELTLRVLDTIREDQHDFIVVNYANPDMVGHTGSLPAAIKAVETVDTALGDISEAIRNRRGWLLVTSDHGNCEVMIDPETGAPHTAHTLNKVPLILVGAQRVSLSSGKLADIAPTLLELMGISPPSQMTGSSLAISSD